MKKLCAVTGAFGYLGKYITFRLLKTETDVITLTNSPNRINPFDGQVKACPFNFDKPEKLVESLRGVSVLYNTYWVRFNHKTFTHAAAVENTLILFDAAREAGVKRIVHISVTNPSEDSPLEYFSGKARFERALKESGIPYAILRPAVIFGKEEILFNNIAWMLRRSPVFSVFGDGSYRIQPVYVDDLAALAVEYGEKEGNFVVNAIGPETFTYRELVETIAAAIGKRRLIVPVPPYLGYLAGLCFGRLMNDVVITLPEIKGMMSGLLCVDTPPTTTTRFSEWVKEHAETLGQKYSNELARRLDRISAYASH
ncbi:MAG: NmrA family NAD(P)-binding protein [Candidatus Accumulibacter sp.]|jgi:NADH dehydrogenase|nr:NmrA family NAD(P)-binding protein [Accumulibacter sp.]